MAKTKITAEPGLPWIETTREFDAPRELLFRAFTEPELLVQWLGPRSLTLTIEEHEVHDGGRWRYIHRDADGNEFAFHGVHHGTPSPDRMVRTFEFEGVPGHVSLETMTLEDRGGKTLVREKSVFESVEDRDGMVESGMEVGVQESHERLDELIARMAPVR
jgi:uncharacterized protein YndB with AHSA1/START domain